MQKSVSSYLNSYYSDLDGLLDFYNIVNVFMDSLNQIIEILLVLMEFILLKRSKLD